MLTCINTSNMLDGFNEKDMVEGHRIIDVVGGGSFTLRRIFNTDGENNFGYCPKTVE